MLTSRDKRFLHKAEQAAQQAVHYKFKIGCVLTKGRKLVSSGYNTLAKTHPLQSHYASLVGKPDAIYLHAEIAAIVEAKSKGIDLTGCVAYVFRRGLGGSIRMARPCKVCMKALKDFGTSCIIYTTDDGIAKECLEEL